MSNCGIEPYLRKAETWLTRNFLGEDFMCGMEAAPETDALRALCCHITALDALRRAIPSLDLILTPNGFGIVSNQNIVPASADRVNRLIESLLSNRDDLASDLLLKLAVTSSWQSSVQAAYFGATLWPNLELATLAGHSADKWTHYKSLRLRAITIEQELAENFISEELMARLRRNMLLQQVTAEERTIIDAGLPEKRLITSGCFPPSSASVHVLQRSRNGRIPTLRCYSVGHPSRTTRILPDTGGNHLFSFILISHHLFS